jgi:hypothetical protein
MSIAELIMTGTERASKSTDWVADSLAKIGDNVTKVLTEREQNRQAQEMLPFLKQNLQAAMTDAQNGKPGQAYSKLLGSLDTQTLNNPQLADFVKLGFNAINQTMDARIASQRTGTSGLESMLPILAMTNPQLAANLASQLQTSTQDYTTPNEFFGPVNEKVEPALPTRGGMEQSLFPEGGSPNAIPQTPSAVATPDQVGPTKQEKQPSPTQAVVAKGFEDIARKLESGVPFSSVMSESTKMIWPKDQVEKYSKGFIAIPKLAKYIPGAEGIAKLDDPETLRQKGMNISSKGGVSLSFENVDPLYNYQESNKPFRDTINEAISTLDADNGLQRAIKILGGFENVSFTTSSGKDYITYEEGGKTKKIEVKNDTRKAAQYILGVPQAAKNAMMPLYGTEIDIPAVGGNRAKENLAEILQ